MVPRAAYAAVFVLTTLGVYVASQIANPAAPPIVAVRPEVPAIASQRPDPNVTEDVQALIAKVPEDHREIFVNNWNQVNTSIHTLSDYTDSHPEDPLARSQLMNAFQQRDLLWDTLVKSPEQF
jgi:hypothetical protein